MPTAHQLKLELKPIPFCRSFGSGIVRYFDKTPASIVCPHFWELNWAYGCPFACEYCYLQGTFRGSKGPRYPWSLNQILTTLDEAFVEIPEPAIFNSGELADSLMNPPLMEKIADEFEQQDRHKLLLLTKSNNVRFLLEKLRKQTIVSFSINASEVWALWEKKTSPPESRIAAARELIEAGYEVRLRIDPIFPIGKWQQCYGKLLCLIFANLPAGPERITLGMPRGLRKTLMYSKDRSWAKGLTEKSGWGLKLPTPLRKEVYTFFLNRLLTFGFSIEKVALCKETLPLSQELRMGLRCNCVW